MRTLIRSLKRLYLNKEISEQKIRSMELIGKITIEELNYILD